MMSIDEFRQLHARMASEKPKLFELIPPDALATEQALDELERTLGAKLPASYKGFLCEFGGGTFGLVNICSADPSSEHYLPLKQEECRNYLPSGLLVVSDDHAGGLYVLQVKEGHAQEPLFYWNYDGGLTSTQFANVLEFAAQYAYRAA